MQSASSAIKARNKFNNKAAKSIKKGKATIWSGKKVSYDKAGKEHYN